MSVLEIVYLYQGSQLPFIDCLLGYLIVTTPSLMRALSRVKVGLKGSILLRCYTILV